jgi:hypothetical protein
VFFFKSFHGDDGGLLVVFHVVIPLSGELNELKALVVLEFPGVVLMDDLHETLDSGYFCCSEVADLGSSFFGLSELALANAVFLESVEYIDETDDFLVWKEVQASI